MPVNFEQAGGDTRMSPSIWADSQHIMLPGMGKGNFIFDDMTRGVEDDTSTTVVGPWTFFGTNADVDNLASYIGGALRLEAQAVTDEGSFLGQWPMAQIVLQSHKKMWFETRIRYTSTEDDLGLAFGMIEDAGLTAAIFDTGAADMANNDFIGFRSLTDLVMDSVSRNGATETVIQENAQTLVTATWYKFGVKFDGEDELRFYVDGSLVASQQMTSTTVAVSTGLGPVVGVFQGDDSAASVALDVDWIAAGYEV